MTTDPSDDLADIRRLRDEALEARFIDPLVAEYHRNSIGMSWDDLAGQSVPVTPLVDTFRVEILGVPRVMSSVAAAVASGVQKATTQMNAALRNPQAARTPGSNLPIVAELVQEGLAGNSLIFRVPAVLDDPADDVINFGGPHPGPASGALRELLNALPENAGDFGAFAGRVESSPQMERQAIQTISTMALATPHGVALNLNSGPRVVRSTLDRQSAGEIREFLQRRKFRRTQETVEGLLDGFRGTRRVFYLITEDGREIAGSVDGSLLGMVQRLANRRVDAVLSATQWVAKSGSLGPKHYELISLSPTSDPEGLFA